MNRLGLIRISIASKNSSVLCLNGRANPCLYLDEIACNNLSVLGSKKVLEETWVEMSSYLALTYVCF